LFKKMTTLLSLVLALAFTTSVAAQDIPTFDPSEAEGLESAYARMYMMDFEALLASPEAAAELDLESMPFYAFLAVFTFEEEDMASENFEVFAEEFANGFFGESTTEPEMTEVDGLGEQAVEYVGELEVDETQAAPTSVLMVQDGENMLISVVSGGQDVSDISTGYMEFMLDGEVGAEVELVEDGTSTGGAFDLMPTIEDTEVLNGLVPFMDMDFLSAGGM
jgi:hypothetical protein